MISRALPLARPLLARPLCFQVARSASLRQIRCASQAGTDPNVADPDMNGGYINPVPKKRALRDPYGGWWDPQERRNFGEPVHEDNDTLGVFSTEPYTHSTPGKAALHVGFFVIAILSLCGAVYQLYPDKASSPRAFPGGLSAELGGPSAVAANDDSDQTVE